MKGLIFMGYIIRVWDEESQQYVGIPSMIGVTGKNGATFTPNVSAEGVLSWDNDGGLDNPPSINVKGNDGQNGIDGAPGRDGADGRDGRDGTTPHIGANNNWFIGDTDTGLPSRGAKGDTGEQGQTGAQGERGERGYSGLVPKVVVPYAPTVEVAANTMTEIGTLTGALTIALGSGVEGFDNEWDFVVQQGATALTVTLPTVSWGMGIAPSFAANSVTVVRLYYIGGTLRGEWCI